MADRFWLREQANFRLSGEVTEQTPRPVKVGFSWIREQDIRAVHPTGPIAPGAIYTGSTYTYTPPVLTTIEQIRANAKVEAARIIRWQIAIQQDLARYYSTSQIRAALDWLYFGHRGLNQTLRSTHHSDGVRTGFLSGWAHGPSPGNASAEDFMVATLGLTPPTGPRVWSHTVSVSALALDGQQPSNLNYASAPSVADLRHGAWADSLASNG